MSDKSSTVDQDHAWIDVRKVLGCERTSGPFPWTKAAVDHVLAPPGLGDKQKLAVLGGTAVGLPGIKA